MQCRLRSYDQPIPGGYHYVQAYPGGSRNFQGPIIETLAQAVANFRAGNGIAGATPKEALIDIDHYNAMRLGCHRLYTIKLIDGGQQIAINPAVSPTITPCKGCGGTVLAG